MGEDAAVAMMRNGAADYLLKDRLARLGPAVDRALSAWRLRRETDERLRLSEQRYRDLVTNVPVGLYRTTADGRIVEANPAMVRMLGFPDRESLLATNIPDSTSIPAPVPIAWRSSSGPRGRTSLSTSSAGTTAP